MPLTFTLADKIARDYGYVLIHTKWSHRRYSYRNTLAITIPRHKELARKTAISIIQSISKQTGIDFAVIVEKYGIKF